MHASVRVVLDTDSLKLNKKRKRRTSMKMKSIMMLVAATVFGLGTMAIAQDDDNAGNVKGKAKVAREDRGAAKDKDRVKTDKVKDVRVEAKAKTKAASASGKSSDTKDKAIKDGDDAKGKRGEFVDKRENNQSKRIQHGIKKGYLTPEETKSLQNQQDKIATMESSYKSDGKLTKDECGQLRDALNVASVNIWSEKHDTDGKQMATYRLGKNVYAKDSYTSLLSNQNMSGADAKALTADFRKMLTLKKSLANDNLSAETQAQKQSEYDELLNKYFEMR
jgi:hypothetical protein